MPTLITSVPPPAAWTLVTPPGSLATFTITLDDQDGNPFPTDGTTWEYVASISAGYQGTPVLTVSSTPSSAGSVTVASPGTLALVLYPEATAALSGSYKHTLWMAPGTDSAFSWITGTLSVVPTPPP